jgi:apolipoprotein N-acyltransferase
VGALIFPPFVGAALGYGALVLFLAYLLGENRTKKSLFWNAYGFGAGFYATSFIWVNKALTVDGDQFVSFIPLVILAMGLFFGLFLAVPALLSGFAKEKYTRIWMFGIWFVVFEWIRSFIFTGFPWNLLGTALSFEPRLISGAGFIGTYGLSFVLLMMLSLTGLLVRAGLRKTLDKTALAGLVFFMVLMGGFALSYDATRADNTNGLRVRLVQPNIEQTLKWDRTLAYRNFRQYINLTQEDDRTADLVVWGETAVPYQLDRDEAHLQELREAIPEGGFLITGVLRGGYVNGELVPYNSLFVINDLGEIKDYYDKAHLVPFGEYLPFRKYLPAFMKPVANVVGDLGEGEKYKNIRVGGLPLMGGAICYESIFPKEVLNPQERPEVLVVLANDGWYGLSAGPYQHLAAARMRAVEEGVSVIRSANTGISAVIAPNGDILGRIGLSQKGVITVRLPNVLSRSTLYGQYGNVILLVLLLFGVGFFYIYKRLVKEILKK